MPAILAPSDKADFDRLENVIREGLETFVEIGNALNEIRERKLYTEVCSTFEAYVQIRWKFSRQRAYQQIAAAETVALLSTTVDTLPDSERTARPLATLPPEQQAEVWKEAVEEAEAEGEKVTAKHVQRHVDKRLPKVPRPKHEKAEDVAAAIVQSTTVTPEERRDLAPKRRPNISHLMNVIEAATGLTNESSDEEIRAIPFNDVMGARLRTAREFIDRVLSLHARKEHSA